MNEFLFRNMSREEANKVLDTGVFTKPENKVYLPRKWFSTSLFRSHYFKSPFYTGETAILKVEVNEDFFRRIFKDGTFILKEPNGFYGYPESTDEILYAKAHKTIDSLYNVGFLDLDRLNGGILDISEIEDEDYIPYLEEMLLQQSLDKLDKRYIDSNLDFYVQVSYDIAILLLKYQTLMLEAINPVIKTLHFSKDINDLKKKNLDKYCVTLRVRFKPQVKCYSLFKEEFFSLNYNEIMKFIPFVDRIDMARLEPPKVFKEYLHIQGDNNYTKHEKKIMPKLDRLDFREFKKLEELLMHHDIKMDDIGDYLPFIRDMKGINQVDPRHIDNLETHTKKSLEISNLVINYFKNQGIYLDSENIVYVKWLMLLHDAGKPYCECDNITTRYSQFGNKDKYTLEIMDKVLDPDILFPIKEIYKIFSLSSLSGVKKIRGLLNNIYKEIMDNYQVNEDEAKKILCKYLYVAFISKVSHNASLKPHAYCSSYVDDLMFFDKVVEVLRMMNINDFVFPYLDYYARVDNAYDEIIDRYYVDSNRTLLEHIRDLNMEDINDLMISYNNKKNIADEQIPYLDIVSTYFSSDDELLDKYFNVDVSEKDKHGNSHSGRVEAYAYVMGRMLDLTKDEIEILLLASQYHDIGRKLGKDHSRLSVEALKRENKIMKNSEYVYFLIEAHGYDDSRDLEILSKYNVDEEEALKLLKIFKDADALDRIRFDKLNGERIALDVSYLRTDVSRHLIEFASALNSSFKINKKSLAPSIKVLLKSV